MLLRRSKHQHNIATTAEQTIIDLYEIFHELYEKVACHNLPPS